MRGCAGNRRQLRGSTEAADAELAEIMQAVEDERQLSELSVGLGTMLRCGLGAHAPCPCAVPR